MSASDLLRRSAEKLRRHAGDIPTGLSPWSVNYFSSQRYPQRVADDQARLLAQTYDGADSGAPVQIAPTAEYIALMHPPVAIALADLLERIYVAPQVAVMPSVREYAERVARAILREEP